MKMKILTVIAPALAAALFVTGCSNTSTFDYSGAYGAMPTFAPLPGNPTVGVLPAEDHRDSDTYALQKVSAKDADMALKVDHDGVLRVTLTSSKDVTAEFHVKVEDK